MDRHFVVGGGNFFWLQCITLYELLPLNMNIYISSVSRCGCFVLDLHNISSAKLALKNKYNFQKPHCCKRARSNGLANNNELLDKKEISRKRLFFGLDLWVVEG
jgi:hypothetical protein